jgi:hypothetical protein
MKTSTGICPELVQALQSNQQWEGDNEPLRTAPTGMDLLAIDPANETLIAEDAGSNPAVGADPCYNAKLSHEEGGKKKL